MHHSILRVISLLVLTLLVSACGKRPQVVTGIQVQSQVVDQDVHLAVKADLNLGAMSFPSVSLPILHPRRMIQLGSIELAPVLGGKNMIKIDVNVSELSDLQAIQASLPNGNSVPLIANNPTLVIPVGNGGRIYLTIGANAVALGAAIPIKTFDAIGSRVGAVNLFPTFMIDKVIGSAGIFTGSSSGQNGFALVADVTQYVQMQNIFVPQMASAPNALEYASQIPSSSKESQINEMILKLNSQKKQLKLR